MTRRERERETEDGLGTLIGFLIIAAIVATWIVDGSGCTLSAGVR